MNLLVEKNVITELKCGSNFAYVLNDASNFSSTDYKVLQSQIHSNFARCMKMTYNGKIQLYYHVENYSPFQSLLPNLDANQFMTVVSNLLAGIIDVKNNGFMSVVNIDTSFEHVYVEKNTFKVRLVYLPLKIHEFGDVASFENALRTRLVRVITDEPALQTEKVKQLQLYLQNGKLSLEDVYCRLGGEIRTSQSRNRLERMEKKAGQFASQGRMKLVALNAPNPFEMEVTKQDFTIGKRKSNDGVIDYNKMLSRVHCRISSDNQGFVIVDLNSTNGTFVNDIKVKPNAAFPIKNGDVIRLANSSFQVVIE